MWVFVKPCPRNPQKVTADHKKLVGSPPNIITIPQADSVCGVVNTWEFFTLWGLQRPGVSRGVIAIQTRINPMKNKTKIIACVIAGLTLTACVGAVNVPPKDADTETETETREAEVMDKIPDLPQIDVGRAYYIGTLRTSLSVFGRVAGFRIDVDFDNRTLNGGKSSSISGVRGSSFGTSRYRTQGDFNVACAIQKNRDGISYRSGNLCITPARQAANYNLEILGSFTDKGVISGTVDYERCAPTCPRFGDTANLTGMIDKQKIVGSFAGDFSGGFTVNRQ